MAELTQPQPTLEQARIESLDVLRGFALLGILLLNILGFGLSSSEYLMPGHPEGLDFAVWAVVDVSAEGAMRALFSILFGAGVVLFAGEGSGRSGWVYYRRNLLLLGFGLLDVYLLLWSGDILFLYGLCALLLYSVRNVRASRLMWTAGILLLLMTVQHGVSNIGMSMTRDAAERVAQMEETPSPELQQMAQGWDEFRAGFVNTEGRAEELAVRAESYASAWAWTAEEFSSMLFFVMPMYLFWDALTMMILGMALYKLGVLQGDRAKGFYLRLGSLALVVGLAANLSEVIRAASSGFGILETFPQMQATYHIGRLGMAMAWMSLIILSFKSLPAIAGRLAAVGRLALTNYLMHSLICLFIFTGAGLGLVGQLARAELYLVVFAIWALQLWFSPWWLARYKFGPVEWLWRGLTYGRFPALKRAAQS